MQAIKIYSNDIEVSCTPMVLDMGELVRSHDQIGNANPAYPEFMQPRERHRNVSLDAVRHIAANLEPFKLDINPEASLGCPIVIRRHEGWVVLSGNGRCMALELVYDSAKVTREGNFFNRAKAYRRFTEEFADRHGLALPTGHNPVAVMVCTDDLSKEKQIEFARSANTSAIEGYSTTEQAKVDTEIMYEAIRYYDPDFQITTRRNKEFVSFFIGKVPPQQRNSLVSESGDLSQTGYNRIMAAVFGAAYDENGLLARFAEALPDDDDIRSITTALSKAALVFTKLSREINQKTISKEFAVGSKIAQAALYIQKLKMFGMSLDDYKRQFKLPSMEDDVEGVVKTLIDVFVEHRRSSTRMAEALCCYANTALMMRIDQQNMQGSEFDLDRPAKALSKWVITNRIPVKRAGGVAGDLIHPESTGLFDKMDNADYLAHLKQKASRQTPAPRPQATQPLTKPRGLTLDTILGSSSGLSKQLRNNLNN